MFLLVVEGKGLSTKGFSRVGASLPKLFRGFSWWFAQGEQRLGRVPKSKEEKKRVRKRRKRKEEER